MADASSNCKPTLIYCCNLQGKVALLKFHFLCTLLQTSLEDNLTIIEATEEDFNSDILFLKIAIQSGAVLERKRGVWIISTNEICNYIAEKCNSDKTLIKKIPELDIWIQFESNFLANQLLSILTSQNFSEKDLEFLAKLDTDFLGIIIQEEPLSVAAISMFSSLYPLMTLNKLKGQLAASYPKLLNWLENMSTHFAGSNTQSQISTLTNWTEIKKGRLCSKFVYTDGLIGNTPQESNKETLNFSTVTYTEEQIKLSIHHWNSTKPSTLPVHEIKHPILPSTEKRNILITSALPYVNNVPHLGNIIGCVLSADVFARYCRAKGYQTLYICGTDEYGTATETKAIQENVTPQEICNKYFKEHKQIYEKFGISFDFFGRTTTKQQTNIAQDIFFKLNNKDYVTQGDLEQLYCENCQRFLADRFVSGVCPLCEYHDAQGDQCDKCGKLINAIELKSPKCKICSKEPIVRSSHHIFLNLPKMQDKIESWVLKASTDGVWSQNAISITKQWLKEKLRSRCISRDLNWGTPVPLKGFENKVFYVWFDAPIGYMSITACYAEEWEQWWKNPSNVQLYQFMAKDNVPFHSVMFPGCLLFTGEPYTLVHHIASCEYLNYESGKFSKRQGVGVFGDMVQETNIPIDIYRFYLLYVRPETQDTVFSWNDLLNKNNTELLNNLGNFINRALTFAKNSFKGQVPVCGNLEPVDEQLIAQVNVELKSYINTLEDVKLRDGIKYILNISRLGNVYIQDQQPWVLVKKEGIERNRAGTIIHLSINLVSLICVLLEPYMPHVCKIVKSQLNIPNDFINIPDYFVPTLPSGHTLGIPVPLFKKIEQSEIDKYQKMFSKPE